MRLAYLLLITLFSWCIFAFIAAFMQKECIAERFNIPKALSLAILSLSLYILQNIFVHSQRGSVADLQPLHSLCLESADSFLLISLATFSNYNYTNDP